MSAKAYVDELLDGYRGDELLGVLIGTDLWPEFLSETGLAPTPTGENDQQVVYRGVPCRPSATPDKINLLTGR